MATTTKLCVRMVNHGQSEIWLGTENAETATRRLLASKEVRNVIQRLSPDAFEEFYREWHVRLGTIAMLDVPNLAEIARELKLHPGV